MEELQIPPYFLCPISLEIMKDPVTISTGITYDRESIENWIFSGKKTTCPVTKQDILDNELIPNVTLRRVIQSWCTLNASHGVERFPTPKPPVSELYISKILRDASLSPQLQLKSLGDLRSIASQNETNKRRMENTGVPGFLASIVYSNVSKQMPQDSTGDALCILYNLGLSEDSLKSILGCDTQFIDSLINWIQHGSYESRAYAMMLLKSMIEVAGPLQINNLNIRFFRGLVLVLRENFSNKASKSAMHILANICHKGRNRIKAAEAGVVAVLIDLLLDSTDKRYCESSLIILDKLCQCADGRAELLKHPGGLAVVSKKILRVSPVASERGVRILYSISKFSATRNVVQEMLQLGVAAKLCMVIQVDCGSKNRERAAEILKLHAKEWKSSQKCIPLSLML